MQKKSNFDATFLNFSVYVLNVNHGLVKGWVLQRMLQNPFLCFSEKFFIFPNISGHISYT